MKQKAFQQVAEMCGESGGVYRLPGMEISILPARRKLQAGSVS
jgi:hypothetical protein